MPPSQVSTTEIQKLDVDGLSEEWLSLEKSLGVRPVVQLNGTWEENRKVLDIGCAKRDATLPVFDDVITNDTQIPVVEPDVMITVRTYKPRDLSKEKRPLAVFYHGGGWALGNIAADEYFCKELVHDTGHVVVSVEYRLSPEAQFPKPLDDSYAALIWAFENINTLGGDSSKVYVTGNSAGGYMAAAVALKHVTSDSKHKLAAQMLRIPFTCDLELFRETWGSTKNVPVFPDWACKQLLNAYAPRAEDRSSYLVSPLLAPDDVIKRLPPTFIDVCSADPLAPSGIAYAKKLESNGVPVRTHIVNGMPHGSFILFPMIPSSREANNVFLKELKWALGQT